MDVAKEMQAAASLVAALATDDDELRALGETLKAHFAAGRLVEGK